MSVPGVTLIRMGAPPPIPPHLGIPGAGVVPLSALGAHSSLLPYRSLSSGLRAASPPSPFSSRCTFLRTFHVVDYRHLRCLRDLVPSQSPECVGPPKDELTHSQSRPGILMAKVGRVSRSRGSLFIEEMEAWETLSRTSRPLRPSSLSLLSFPSPSTPRNSPRHLAAAGFPWGGGGGHCGSGGSPLNAPPQADLHWPDKEVYLGWEQPA